MLKPQVCHESLCQLIFACWGDRRPWWCASQWLCVSYHTADAKLRFLFCVCAVFRVFQLRQLEERLLDTISAVQGTILDDDTVVQALEDLKGEAGDVAKEVRLQRLPPSYVGHCL